MVNKIKFTISYFVVSKIYYLVYLKFCFNGFLHLQNYLTTVTKLTTLVVKATLPTKYLKQLFNFIVMQVIKNKRNTAFYSIIY